MEIQSISTTKNLSSQLVQLLIDCVASGASVGFLMPIDAGQVNDYWQGVEADLKNGRRKLFVALENELVVGAVQLSLSCKANGKHRGEVEKLMVHTTARGKGLGKLLMKAMEQAAEEMGLSLLVLDTRFGDVASSLYRAMAYIEAGSIPNFALSSAGKLEPTVFFYKQLTIFR